MGSALPMDEQRAVEFLGSKRRLLPFIVGAVSERAGGATDILDLFSGTGSVSGAFKSRGFRVVANDHLGWCSTVTAALLLNDSAPCFDGVVAGKLVRSPDRSAYSSVLAYLNSLEPKEGFIYRNYSPASAKGGQPGRMYFTARNAGRIDAIRCQIAAWESLLRPEEGALLLADLVRAADAVSNVAGTYGAFLKRWKASALGELTMRPTTFLKGSSATHAVHCSEAQTLAATLDVDVVYADPPYTKRQYAAYYHVLETIVLADEPTLVGSTGLRPWREKSSDFCYRSKAPRALAGLVASIRCRDFFLSYSEDGQIAHDEIVSILSSRGPTEVLEATLPRYKSSRRLYREGSVRERLYHLRPGPVADGPKLDGFIG